jgi:hypothetical protein
MKFNDSRRWMYHKTEPARIFEKGEEIPVGWYDSPAFDDPRTRKMWDGPDEDDVADVIETPKKYPSQMNKEELAAFGKGIGIEFNEDMTKKEMLSQINAAIEANKEG